MACAACASLKGPSQACCVWLRAGSGTAWLFPLVEGAPPVGWSDAAKYMVLPVLLVAAQFASSAIISPPIKQVPALAPAEGSCFFALLRYNQSMTPLGNHILWWAGGAPKLHYLHMGECMNRMLCAQPG